VSATPDALGTLVLPPKVTLSCVPISAAASGRAGVQGGWKGGVCMGVAAEIAFMPATENKNGVSRQTFVLWEREGAGWRGGGGGPSDKVCPLCHDELLPLHCAVCASRCHPIHWENNFSRIVDVKRYLNFL